MSETPPAGIAVVTVAYNSGSHLRAFLASVRVGQSSDVPIVVADNGSADLGDVEQMCAEYSATLLRFGENYGYGGAINRAVATLPATATSILISNPDVVFADGAMSQLHAALGELDHAGAVGPRILNSNGSVYPSARRLPSLRTGTGHAIFARIWPSNPWTAAYVSEVSESAVPRKAGWLSGSCILIDRSAFAAIGGFDDAFFMYFEDVDLGYRLGKAGWNSYYVPAAVITHAGAHSTNTESKRMIVAHHRSAYRYMSRKYLGWYLAPLRWSLRAGLAIRAGWLSRK